MAQDQDMKFATEKTLGKLSKWLRIFGFDTIFEYDVSPEQFVSLVRQGRIFLTRSTRLPKIYTSGRTIFIRSDKVIDQLKEVIESMGLVRDDVKPFARCIRCNTPVEIISKESVFGKVPDYIWETQGSFHSCRQCHRIYWSGSHTRRSVETIDRLFNNTNRGD